MKKHFCFLLSVLFFSLIAIRCSNNSNQSQHSNGSQTGKQKGYEAGHKLKGRYVNTESGIKSFTFSDDGSFERAGAVSGSIPGHDYVASEHNSGTYQLAGKILKVTYQDGVSEEMPIEPFSSDDNGNLYSMETPSRLSINDVAYIHSTMTY